MFVHSSMFGHLLDFCFCNPKRINIGDVDSMMVYMKHDLCRFCSSFFEIFFKYFDDKLYGGEVIIVKYYFVFGWTLCFGMVQYGHIVLGVVCFFRIVIIYYSKL